MLSIKVLTECPVCGHMTHTPLDQRVEAGQAETIIPAKVFGCEECTYRGEGVTFDSGVVRRAAVLQRVGDLAHREGDSAIVIRHTISSSVGWDLLTVSLPIGQAMLGRKAENPDHPQQLDAGDILFQTKGFDHPQWWVRITPDSPWRTRLDLLLEGICWYAEFLEPPAQVAVPGQMQLQEGVVAVAYQLATVKGLTKSHDFVFGIQPGGATLDFVPEVTNPAVWRALQRELPRLLTQLESLAQGLPLWSTRGLLRSLNPLARMPAKD